MPRSFICTAVGTCCALLIACGEDSPSEHDASPLPVDAGLDSAVSAPSAREDAGVRDAGLPDTGQVPDAGAKDASQAVADSSTILGDTEPTSCVDTQGHPELDGSLLAPRPECQPCSQQSTLDPCFGGGCACWCHLRKLMCTFDGGASASSR